MSSLTRRGAAALALASVLLLAPLVTSAAYADDEPIGDTPVAEAPEAHTPGEAPETEPAPVESPEPEPASFARTAPEPEQDCDATNSQLGLTMCVDFVGNTAVFSLNRTSEGDDAGYSLYVQDQTTGDYSHIAVRAQANSTPPISVIPGHRYYAYGDIISASVTVSFTFSSPAAPNAPTGLQIERLATATGFDVAWEAPAEVDDNPIVSYNVTVTPATSGIATTYSTTALGYQLTGLTASESYEIAVSTVAHDGQTSVAATSTVTLQAIAPTAITDLVLSRDVADLSASWTAPAYNGGDSPVRYAVYLYADNVMIDSYDQLATTIDIPRPAAYGVEYTVVVSPFTSSASGGPSTTSNAVERPDSAPAAPLAHPFAYGHKDAWIYVSWSLGAVTGSDTHSVIVTLYDTAGAVVDKQTVSLAGNRTGMNFTGLPNDTDFTVTVAAVNKAGTSPESAAVPATTLPLTPPAYTPEDLALIGAFTTMTVSLSGSQLTAHIDGAAAGEWVFGYAYSSPTALGWTQVDAAGMARWNIAAAGLPNGAHTLAVQNNFGEIVGSAGFTVGAPARAGLAQTGSDPSGTVTLALAMLALGVLATATRLRRRTRA